MWINKVKRKVFLWNKRMPLRLKCRIYKIVEKQVMLYGLESLAVDNKAELRVNESVIVMLRLMSIVTMGDEIINEIIRGCEGIAAILDKIRKNRLRFVGNVIN